MADTLSQEEIDQLLNSIGGGESSESSDESDALGLKTPLLEDKKIREYDFKRPSKFSREQKRTLQLIHETFARELSTYLSGRCRTFVEIRYASIDQITFSEFQQSLTSPTYISIFSTDILSGNAIMQMGLDIGYVIIDRLLGGPGVSLEDFRSPTDIEMGILGKETAVMLKSLAKSWDNVANFDIQLDQVETNPQFIQIAPPGEMIVLITLSIRVKDTEGLINICFPSSTLEPISDKLTTRMWQQNFKKSEQSHKDLQNILMLSSQNLTAILGKSSLSLSDILRLQVGDVIRLDSFKDESIDINVQNQPIYKAKIGTNRGYYAVNIEEENERLLEKLIVNNAMLKDLEKEKEKEKSNTPDGGEK